jgi:hypothetical protein
LARAESGKKSIATDPAGSPAGLSSSCSLPKFCAIGGIEFNHISPADSLAWHRKKPSDIRSSVSRERLQSAITKDVKKADPKCEGFIGVIVQQQQTPKAGFDANWAIKGVLLGKADRDTSSMALAAIVERMQREFSLAADVSGSPEEPGELKSNVSSMQ